MVDKTWLCDRCTLATRPIKVLFRRSSSAGATALQPKPCSKHGEELVSSSSTFVVSFKHGRALLVLIAPYEANPPPLPPKGKIEQTPPGANTCVRDWLFDNKPQRLNLHRLEEG